MRRSKIGDMAKRIRRNRAGTGVRGQSSPRPPSHRPTREELLREGGRVLEDGPDALYCDGKSDKAERMHWRAPADGGERLELHGACSC
jgi:hypothetical protein